MSEGADGVRVSIVERSDRTNLVLRWIDPVRGCVRQKSAGTRSRKDAERVAARLEDEINSGRETSYRIGWSAFCLLYAEERLGARRKATRKHFWTAVNSLNEFTKLARLSELTARRVGAWQAWLRDRSTAEVTIGSYTRALLTSLVWAERRSMLRSLPKVDMPKVPKGRRKLMKGRPLSAAEFQKMLDAVPVVFKEMKRIDDSPKALAAMTATWQRYLRGLWLSGLRLEESLAVSWDVDADFAIDLSTRRPKFKILAAAQKADRDELLPITPDFFELLDATPSEERHGPVFPIGFGITWTSKLIAKFGRKAGILVDRARERYATAHDLRRSFGTRWAKQVKPALLQRLMRHGSIETTMRYYVDLDTDDIADEIWAGR